MEYELFEDKDRPHKKKKLHELLDKYGTIDELEQHGSVEDNLEYMFSGNKELLDEVLAERKMGMLKQPLKQVQGDVVQHDAISDVQHDGGSAVSKENIVNDEENDVDDMKNHTPKTRQRETLTQYARESLPATSRSSLDDEDMAKNAAKHPMYQAPREKEVESLRARSLADRVKENQSAENEYNGTKSDGENEEKENDIQYVPSAGFMDIYYSKKDEQGNFIYKGIRDEEGGYSERIVDTPTNFGVTQNSLDEYNNWKSSLKKGKNFPKNVKDIQSIQAMQILDEMYYQRYKINKLKGSQITSNLLDLEINAGPVAGYLLSDAMNEFGKKKFLRNQVINDSLGNAINTLSDDDKVILNDLYTKKRMDYYFKVIDNKPYKINNLNGWYDRTKKFYSVPKKFDELYKFKKLDYFRKYQRYYTGR